MQLFHGSTLEISKPIITNRRTTLDFGTGFYTTTNELQAREFAAKTHRRRGFSGVPTVSVFAIDLDAAKKEFEVLEFLSPDSQWLEFVVHNRKYGRNPACNASIIIGPVANDDVFATIALYEAHQLTAVEAIERLKVKKLFDQVLFCNDSALARLRFVKSYIVGDVDE